MVSLVACPRALAKLGFHGVRASNLEEAFEEAQRLNDAASSAMAPMWYWITMEA